MISKPPSKFTVAPVAIVSCSPTMSYSSFCITPELTVVVRKQHNCLISYVWVSLTILRTESTKSKSGRCLWRLASYQDLSKSVQRLQSRDVKYVSVNQNHGWLSLSTDLPVNMNLVNHLLTVSYQKKKRRDLTQLNDKRSLTTDSASQNYRKTIQRRSNTRYYGPT